jgi:flagellar motor protein MotB
MKPILRKSTIFAFLVFCLPSLFSQILSKKEFIKAVKEADVFYYYNEDYEKAADLYQKLFNIYPDNCNLSAKLGICYLNIDGKKAESLRLLLKASSNIVSDDKDYIEFGEKAPLETYLYLAIAYHHNDSLQKAISFYYNAKKRLGRTKLFREEYIDKQISDCRYALEMEKKPQPLVTNLFAPWLTEYPGASSPALSKNDSVFVFTYKKDDKTHILCSYKTNIWNKPVDITRQLGGYDNCYSNSLTGDGKQLILYKLDGVDGNLYISQRKDTTWTRMKSLNINTIYWESHGFITPDGKTLYFASNRPGGEGELDIWVSEKAENGSWKSPVNCGNVINTPYNENTPFFDPTTNILYFSSVGHVSMGGYDVYQSLKKNDTWSNPVGLPYELNNTTENIFYILNNNGQGFITSLYDEKTETRNIYSILTGGPTDKTIIAKGEVSLQDGMPVDPGQTLIQLTNQKTGETQKIRLDNSKLSKFEANPVNFRLLISPIKKKSDSIYLNKKSITEAETTNLTDTVTFKFEIKPGDYNLFISHQGYKTDTIYLNIPSTFSSNYVPVNVSLIPDKVFAGDFLTIKNILFDFDSYKLTDQARASLEILKSNLLDYPDLRIEVAGYTDSKGSTEYNKRLADSRAQAVIDYIAESGISRSRFIKEAFGATGFVAINTNSDGSDNPEGRKYNRRAAFGIINPKTGIVIRQKTYIPEHLRHLPITADTTPKEFNGKVTYTIQLVTVKKQLNLNQFKNIDGVREIVTDDGYFRYVCGEYKSFSQAKSALATIQKTEFKNAFIREINLLINK